MSDTNPTTAEQAAEHLVEKLQQMADDAMRTATSQEAAAEGTRNTTRQLKYEESAAFHRALASEVDEVLYKLRARSAGYPGAPGDAWQDNEDDVWVLCADGQMRMAASLVDPCDPVAVTEAYGPLVRLQDDRNEDSDKEN